MSAIRSWCPPRIFTGILLAAVLSTLVGVPEEVCGEVPDPAVLYAQELGYDVDCSDGDDCLVVFPDSSECEVWSFYRGECGNQWSYCERDGGGTLENRVETMSTWTASYAVCSFPDGSECQEQDYFYGNCSPGTCYEFSLTQGCQGLSIPGDCSQDGFLDITDAVCVFNALFFSTRPGFPCGSGLPSDPGNVGLMDWQPDGTVDLSDGVALLNYLFLNGPAHPLAVPGEETSACVSIPDCSGKISCRSDESPEERACRASGGTVVTIPCCEAVRPFPDLCLIGACGCPPESSHLIKVCDCGPEWCFDGSTCIRAE